ncbi:MAG TPA: hypothetical protein VFN67_37385 [Polyangiales bacterium]|nr:hypothetical protein [Polyangiales bacterium]
MRSLQRLYSGQQRDENGALDTEEGGAGEHLYEALGWTRLGVIPGYALGTYGGLLGATFFYKQLV